MVKIFFCFIIMFHWLTCLWYYIAKQDFDPNDSNVYTVWVPATLRQLGPTNDVPISHQFYEQLSNFQRYTYCLYCLITLILGNDMGPVNTFQVVIGIMLSIGGQFLMSLFFGEVSVIIYKMN
jgi:hypothetical protein